MDIFQRAAGLGADDHGVDDEREMVLLKPEQPVVGGGARDVSYLRRSWAGDDAGWGR